MKKEFEMKKMKNLDHKTNQELVDMILDWAVTDKAPKEFKPAYTIDMHRLLLSGCSLTPKQRLGLINVIIGFIFYPRKKKRTQK